MIRNIWAVGRNYAEHAKELGNEVPSEPLIFLKAGSCAVLNASEFLLPAWTQEVHHEVELALQFDEHLKVGRAAVALDLTERKLQKALKEKGSPWTLAKSFTNSCPVSDFFEVRDLQELRDLEITLRVNGDLRQQGRTSQMIFPLGDVVKYVVAHFPVCPGDLLLTGTPSGVGAVKRGDVLVAEITGKVRASWTVT